ncbi:DUF2807 domain-containing protein, partial [Nostoc sp. 3335mG]
MRWVVILALALAACGSDGKPDDAAPVVRDEAALRDFTAVTLESADQVEIAQGSAFAVWVEGSKAAQDRLNIRREGDVLKIGRKDGGLFDRPVDTARIRITMPVLQAATLAGAGDIAIDRVGEGFA